MVFGNKPDLNLNKHSNVIMMGHADWSELKIYPDGTVYIYSGEYDTDIPEKRKFPSQSEALKYYKKLGYYDYDI